MEAKRLALWASVLSALGPAAGSGGWMAGGGGGGGPADGAAAAVRGGPYGSGDTERKERGGM